MGAVCDFTSIKTVIFYLDTGTLLFNISYFYGTGEDKVSRKDDFCESFFVFFLFRLYDRAVHASDLARFECNVAHFKSISCSFKRNSCSF
jgi:hypothetical protein